MRQHPFLERFVSFIIRFRWAFVALLAALSFFSLTAITRGLQVDNSLGIWFLEDDYTYNEYLQYQRDYGSDEIIIAAIPVTFNALPTAVAALNELAQEIESLDGVNTTFSLAKAVYPVPTSQGLRMVPFYDAKRQEQQQLALFEQLKDYRKQLLSDDVRYTFFYIQLDESTLIEQERSALVSKIETTIRSHFSGAHISGPPILNEAYNSALKNEAGLFGALTLLVISLLLFVLLPDRRFAWVASIAVILPTLFLFGLIAALGIKLNMISALIPTLLLVYALSDVMHILNALQQQRRHTKDQSAVQILTGAIRLSIVPCALTTLTTIIGYFALYYSALPALKSMGLWASVGIVIAFVVAYLVIIIGTSFMQMKSGLTRAAERSPKIYDRFIGGYLIDFLQNRSRAVLALSSVVLIAAWALALMVRVDTDSLSLLSDSAAKDDLYSVEKALGSSSRLQLNLMLNDAGDLTFDEFLNKASEFHEKLESNPNLGNVFSVHSLRSFMQQRYAAASFDGSDPKALYQNTLTDGSITENSFLNLVSPDLNTLIFTVGFSQMPTSQLSDLLRQIESDFEQEFGPETTVSLKTYGFATVFAKLNDFVVASQLKTFALAFLAIFLVLLLYFRSLRKALLIMLPNLVPIFSVFALMTLLDISLGVTTAMITPIILGIAMDDTLHLIYHFVRPSSAVSTDPSDRLNDAISYSAPALMTSTFSLVAGFAIIALSSTPAVSEFGLLCLAAIAIALVADLTFLPALIRRFWR